ncbi:MAG: universal stress protein [Chloroflexi bacterium]|nr:universal stress protein [Chloroflexota bacterium]
MYSRILVPLDGSDLAEHALPFAITLSRALSCPMELLRIPEDKRTHLGVEYDFAPITYDAMCVEGRETECLEYLDTVAEKIRMEGIDVSTKVRSGLAPVLIVDETKTDADTIVVMASHGRSGVTRWIMGSVADAVLRESGGPLLLIRPIVGEKSKDPHLDRIVLPMDGSLVAEQVLPHVTRLAKALGMGVDLVRVTPSVSEYYRDASVHHVGGMPATTYPSYEEFVKGADVDAQSYMDDIKSDLEVEGVTSIETHLLHGSPTPVITDMARSNPGNIVMIATHGRSGVGRWVLGSVADSIARHSGCPVFLVRAKEEG